MRLLEKLNDHLSPCVEAHQDCEIAFEYRPSRAARVGCIALPTGRRLGDQAAVTVTVRQEDDGRPGKLLAEASALVSRLDWYDFAFPAPVPVHNSERYWIGVSGTVTAEPVPYYPVRDLETGELGFFPAFDARFMYVLPAHQFGGVVFSYYVNRSGQWEGPFEKCFIGRTYGAPL